MPSIRPPQRGFYMSVAALFALVSSNLTPSLSPSTTSMAHAASVHASAGNAPVVTPCGVSDVTTLEPPSHPAPTNPVHTFAGKYGVSAFDIVKVNGADQMYILDVGRQQIYVYSMASGTKGGGFSLPWTPNANILAVDPSGNVYLAQGNSVSQFSNTGHTNWTTTLRATISGLYALSTANGFRLGVVQQGLSGSTLLDSSGSTRGVNAIVGSTFTTDSASGDLISTDTHYVRVYDPNGNVLHTFGANQNGNAVGSFHFYQLGGVARASDGLLYIADAGRGIEAATADGLYQGVGSDGTLGSLSERSSMAFYNGNIYFANGGTWNNHQTVSYISLSDLQALVSLPRAPNPILGFGAGLAMSSLGDYVGPGQTPQVNVVFDPWWTAHSGDVTGQVTVRERKQVLAGQAGTPQTFILPSTAGSQISIPVHLPTATPGYYQVEAQLLKNGTVVGNGCLLYGVGVQGDTLDLASLPDAPDYGGGTPSRDAMLASDLGFNAARIGLDWSKLLPNGATTCSNIDFSAYDAEIRTASQEAAATGVTLEVEVSLGTNVEVGLVNSGQWGQCAQQVVNHWKSYIHYWEAWREPNATFSNPADYVNKVLKPFYQAVRAADPSAKVLGGTVVGLDFSYWGGIGQAGGFQYMDIVAVHAYTSHNRSFEEEGLPAAFQHFHQVLGQYNAANLPVWNTEVAWWSDGPANLYSQADKLIRYRLLSYDAGIKETAYYILEGGFSDNGVSDSLIQYSSPQNPYYVKPAAIAAMVYKTQIGNRPYLGQVATNAPHVYGVLFGPGAGQSGDLLVLWSDDMPTSEQVKIGAAGTSALSVTDLLGASRSVSLSNGAAMLTVDGSPQYIHLPDTAAPVLTPAETYGSDLALVNFGTHATASSANLSNQAAYAVDGHSDANNAGDFTSTPAWASAPGDATPMLTVTWPQKTQIDRVLVSSHSIGSIEPGLRDYDVQTQNADGSWTTVASVRGDFYWRRHLLTFSPQTTTALRIVCRAVNDGGMAGGLAPWFWPTDQADLTNAHLSWYGPAIIDEVEAYGPGTLPDQPTATPVPFAPIYVNSGGPSYTDAQGHSWQADKGYNGGNTSYASRPILGTNAAPLYQTERYGNFNYYFAVPNGDYNVTLKFAETVWSSVGQRVFNVTINGQQVLTNFDILSQVSPNTALDKTFATHVTNGSIQIYFTTVTDAAKVNAIQIVPATPPPTATSTRVPATPTATPSAVPSTTAGSPGRILVVAGGQAYTDSTGRHWSADAHYSGGHADSSGARINGTTDSALYDSERYGNFSYAFVVPNGTYHVTLKFAETVWSSVGQRVFNVTINGQQVLTNFDILSQVPPDTALDKTFPLTVTNGQITVAFRTVADNAKVDAIAIGP